MHSAPLFIAVSALQCRLKSRLKLTIRLARFGRWHRHAWVLRWKSFAQRRTPLPQDDIRDGVDYRTFPVSVSG